MHERYSQLALQSSFIFPIMNIQHTNAKLSVLKHFQINFCETILLLYQILFASKSVERKTNTRFIFLQRNIKSTFKYPEKFSKISPYIVQENIRKSRGWKGWLWRTGPRPSSSLRPNGWIECLPSSHALPWHT